MKKEITAQDIQDVLEFNKKQQEKNNIVNEINHGYLIEIDGKFYIKHVEEDENSRGCWIIPVKDIVIGY